MKNQSFRFVQTDAPTGKTHSIAVYVTYPLREVLAGVIEWNGIYYGYTFRTTHECTGLTQNVMGEVAITLHELNAGQPCKYIVKNDF